MFCVMFQFFHDEKVARSLMKLTARFEPHSGVPTLFSMRKDPSPMDEKELESLKLAHSCTIEQACVLIESDLETYEHPVYVFTKWCKGCSICVDLCPKQTLTLGKDFKVYQTKPEDCILCGLCEQRCPDLAIFVRQSKKEEKKSAKK